MTRSVSRLALDVVGDGKLAVVPLHHPHAVAAQVSDVQAALALDTVVGVAAVLALRVGGRRGGVGEIKSDALDVGAGQSSVRGEGNVHDRAAEVLRVSQPRCFTGGHWQANESLDQKLLGIARDGSAALQVLLTLEMTMPLPSFMIWTAC